MKKIVPWLKTILRVFGYLLYTLISLCLILIVGSVGITAGAVSAIMKEEKQYTKEDFQKNLDNLFQTSYAYFLTEDKNGKPIRIGSFRYEGNERKLIRSKHEVNPKLIDAFIAIEDRDFFKHKGVVPRSLIRAAWQQATDAEVTTGGSTLTQQLVKNLVLKNSKKNLARKTKEIILALRMERMYNKDQILVYYMNSLFFGEGAHGHKMYGVQAAAKGLFNKEPKDLNLAQAAYIAGMVQRPNDLNPFSEDTKNFERGKKRMKMVLDKMLETKKITKAEYDEALKFDIKKSFAKPEQFQYAYKEHPYIMFALETEAAETLMELDNLDIEELSKQGKYRSTLQEYKTKVATGGYHFYTTIDKDLYEAINQAATKGLTFHTRTYKGIKSHEQLGAAIIENKTGAVLAFVPGTSPFEKNQKNHALDVTRQPGSSIKPLLVYAPALEEDIISPNSLIVDERIPKSDGSGYYRNAGGSYRGPVTATQALKFSYNIPAIKTFNSLGHEKGFNYLRRLGLPPHPHDGEAAAIGGATNGYTVVKMTAAFSTFGNGGKYNKPYMISKITDANGKVIWEHKTNSEQVFSPQTAYQITRMLKEVVNGGTASYIGSRIKGYNLVGKTGTTSRDRDQWFIGYTPEITLGVWGGYDYNFRMSHNPNFTKRAWVNIFKAAAKQSPHYFPKNSSFQNPGGLDDDICGFDCDKVKSYQEKQKKIEEQKRQKTIEKQKSLIRKPIPIKPNRPNPNPEPPANETPNQSNSNPCSPGDRHCHSPVPNQQNPPNPTQSDANLIEMIRRFPLPIP